MRKFKNLDDLKRHALRTGASLDVGGTVFNSAGERHEVARKQRAIEQAVEQPKEQPQQSSDQAMMVAHAAYTKASTADAQITALKQMVESQKAEIEALRGELSKKQEPVVENDETPVEWKFSISRDADGSMTGVTAKPVVAKKSMTLADRALDILESRGTA